MSEERRGATTDDDRAEASRLRRLLESLESRRERFQQRHPLVRWLFVLAGVAVIAAGVAMLVLPGPGLLVIALGLAMLALQFEWAERLLERAVEQAEQVGEAAVEASPARKALTVAVMLGGAAALVAWAYLGDVPLLPV